MRSARTAEERLERLVCGEHCRFFKPWQEETRRCGGHDWLLRQVQADPATLEALEKLRGVKAPPPLRADALLLRTACTRCDYYPYNCRYRSPTGPDNAEPCGGVLVLDLLLDRDLISPEALYDAPWLREAAGS